MAVLGAGGVLATVATSLMASSQFMGTLLAVLAFLLIGIGVGACGTCLLVLLAAKVHPERRAAAATITWIMMIAGFAITAGVVGSILDPFSFGRLIAIAASVALFALVATVLALWGIEGRRAVPDTPPETTSTERRQQFVDALRDVLDEPQTRRFGLFVFVSMLAYSAQDLVLEPFAGAVLGLTPGESTKLGGTQHGGVLVGMLVVAILGSVRALNSRLVLRICMIVGCLSSGALLGALALAGFVGASWPIQANVFALGIANGAFAVAAIGSMMALVSQGHEGRDGTRMGVWGAAQAMAFGLGGILGTAAVDVTRLLTGSVPLAYAIVFIAQALMFGLAAYLATQLTRRSAPSLGASLTRSLATEAGST